MNHPSSSTASSRHAARLAAFTLTELLIVIAIVAILTAIVIPTVSTLRSSARSAECLGNLRQLGSAFLLYAQDHRGSLPATTGKYNDTGTATGGSWSIALMKEIGMAFPHLNQENPFLCPAASTTYPEGNAKRTYAMNWENLPTDPSFAASRGWEQPTKLAQHSAPARTVLLIDSKSGGDPATGDGYDQFQLSTLDARADWRHDNAINTLFVDGHAERIPVSEKARLQESIQRFGR